MKNALQRYFKEEEGTITLEAAFVVPPVVFLICIMLLGNILTYDAACQELAKVKKENQAILRQPGAVIHNTDLVMAYIEKWKEAWEEKV